MAAKKISHLAITCCDVSARDEFENRYSIRKEGPIINIAMRILYISTIIAQLFVYSLLWLLAVEYLIPHSLLVICFAFLVFEVFGFDTNVENARLQRKKEQEKKEKKEKYNRKNENVHFIAPGIDPTLFACLCLRCAVVTVVLHAIE